jgi:hypothetical protein
VAAKPPRDELPALPATRAAAPREDTTGSSAIEERGSKDATRLSSVREIGDFPLAVRMHGILTTLPDGVQQAARIRRILATSRESIAFSNDSESRAARRRSRLEPCERAAPFEFPAQRRPTGRLLLN